MAMEEDHHHHHTIFPQDSDLDLSFTTTTTTIASSSARSSLARSSLCLSFNESTRLSSASASTSTTTVPNLHSRPHRKSDPNWSAIKAATNLSSDGTLHLRHLKLVKLVGSGNLGRVFLCRLRDYEHSNFAIKVVDKNSLTSKKLSHVQTEGRILSSLDHPFLPTLYAHLEVSHYTCFLIDFCPNGDLHSLLRKQPSFRLPIDSVRFYAAEVLVALEYLHSLGIVYRDLKPENILIREDGHIMLSDFDLCFNADVVPKLDHYRTTTAAAAAASGRHRSRWYGGNNHRRRRTDEEIVTEFVAEPTTAFSKSCVGTHEYLAPELVNGGGHGNGVDWWAFGVLVYELLYGRTPFRGASKESTLRNIASSRVVTFEETGDAPPGTAEAKDLIEKLLVKDHRRRLGCNSGATEIKRHPFFDGIKWPLIRTYSPPELRGVTVRRNSRSHASHVSSPSKTRRWIWKGLNYLLMKNKGCKRNLNSNQNYYCYSKSDNIVKNCGKNR